MRAGLLNNIISVEKPEVISDEYGANSLKWVQHIPKTRAKVTYGRGSRTNENNEITFAYEVIFTIRIYHKVDERMRIQWEGKKYRILSIQEDRTLQQLTIKTELINE